MTAATAALLALGLGLGSASLEQAQTRFVPTQSIDSTHICPYPGVSEHLDETGTVQVGYDVEADGRLDHVRLVKSSGHKRLDDAALTCVAQRWRNRPATRDGIAIASPNHRVNIQFTLSSTPHRGWQPGEIAVDLAAALLLIVVAAVTGFVTGRRLRVRGRVTCSHCGAVNLAPNRFRPPRYCNQCGQTLTA